MLLNVENYLFKSRQKKVRYCLLGVVATLLCTHNTEILCADDPAENHKNSARLFHSDQELLRYAFTDPLIPGEQIHEPITTLEQLHRANLTMFLPIEHFFDAYKKLKLIDAVPLTLNRGKMTLLRLTYQLASQRYETYAYTRLSNNRSPRAALIIPGSAFNLATGIYQEIPSNNHTGIMPALGERFDRYIFIKPNEDCLALHNGKAKLNKNFFVNWHLEAGGSYSAHYIANTLAFAKYLQSKYSKLVVAGLSQGGAAAVLNALQSDPDAAVIASGFSIVNKQALWSGHNQIIIPGLRRHLSHETIRNQFQELNTRLLFTYGKEETGTYRIEATEGLSRTFLSPCENVSVRVHDGGHEYPTKLVAAFLRRAVPSYPHYP